MISTTSKLRVRYAETDKMGIVYHTNYFVWFELCRVEMLDHIGLSYRDLEARGFLLPVLEIAANYRKPAYFDDRIEVTCFIDEAPSLRINISYEVRRGEELLVTGSSRHAFMSPSGRPVKPPKDVLDHFMSHF
ncbi:acyl-CoA thioesterase [Cerasicoccus arenae]|uniref:acyl-CoA thioesterase n=1 Tax=Cerasicoccus arenae TaxID=424488 RepID=UPI001676BFA4|nr:thioesterase family protein [Cerasicoccus arenae]MBK1858577.1 acyl-CoA thioesterase [Cerasicoccus arenae]